MTSYLVTGGAGFIGSSIVEELLQRSERVRVLDNFSTGKRENLAPFLNHIELVEGDLRDAPAVRQATEDVDYVLHQAALPSVPRSIDDPLASHQVNATGTLNLLLAAREAGVRRVVYAASSSAYGDSPALPKQEDTSPNPKSPYAVSKLAGEYYCRNFEEIYEIPTVCLRYFNVYGPRQDPNSQYSGVISKFTERVARGTPPTVFGDGEQTRDFVFVKDVVAANVLAAESDATGVFNVGRGESVSLNQLARMVLDLMDKDLEPVYREPRPGDIRHSLGDISRARNLLGYQPSNPLRHGLSKTIEFITQHRKALPPIEVPQPAVA